MFVREHVALLLCCHYFGKENAIDFYAQLCSKIDLETCHTSFALALFWQRKCHRLLRTTAFKVGGGYMLRSFCVSMIWMEGAS